VQDAYYIFMVSVTGLLFHC